MEAIPNNKELKKELIENTNLKHRTLSVTSDGNAIHIYVKDETYPLSAVETIVNKYKSKPDVCQASGETLYTGAETFIFVEYYWDMDFSEEWTNEIIEVIKPVHDLGVSNFDSCTRYEIRLKKAIKLLEAYLNDKYDVEYTEADCRVILGKINNGMRY